MLTRNLPILLVFGLALVIGVGAIIVALAEDDPEPVPTLSDFDAAQAAKSAYYTSDPSVAKAKCTTDGWDSGTDIWHVECVMEREGGVVETTLWRVTPDAVATRIDDSGA